MDILRVIVSLLVTTAVGWNVIFLILRRDTSFLWPERAALSCITGLGVITLQMFFYSLTGVPFSLSAILLPHVAVAIVAGFVFLNSMPATEVPKPAKKEAFDIFLIGGICFQVFQSFFKALIKPMDSFDSIGNFAFKAKMFFIEGRIPYELFSNRAADIQHPDYPLFLPLSEAWQSMFLGKWDDLLVKVLFPMFFASLLVILYFTAKRIIGRRLALVSAFFLATVPHFLNYATIGYAEFALAMFYSVSFFYIFLWISHRKNNSYLVLAVLFSLFAIWTKNEGIMLSLVNVVILLLYAVLNRKDVTRSEIAKVLVVTFLIAAVSFAWLGFVFGLGFANETVNKDTFKLGVAFKHLDRAALVLYDFQKHVFGPKKWNISLLVFIAGLIFYCSKAFKGNAKYITLSVLIASSGYTLVYLITPLEIHFHLQTVGSRLPLHFLPLVILWIGYMTKEISDAEGHLHR